MSLILEWEQETHGDILMIDMEENMNEGKSFEYFASLANMYPSNVSQSERPWDYAMKLDDDSFLNIPNLLEKLRPMIPREQTWFVSATATFTDNRRVAVILAITTCSGQDTSSRGIW